MMIDFYILFILMEPSDKDISTTIYTCIYEYIYRIGIIIIHICSTLSINSLYPSYTPTVYIYTLIHDPPHIPILYFHITSKYRTSIARPYLILPLYKFEAHAIRLYDEGGVSQNFIYTTSIIFIKSTYWCAAHI